MIYVFILLAAILSGLAKSVMDISNDDDLFVMSRLFRGRDPRWRGWDSRTNTWRLKWRHGLPEAGPAFPGASTIFVAFTDLWHLSQMATWGLMELAFGLLVWQAWAACPTTPQHTLFIFTCLITIPIARRIAFELAWRHLKSRP